MMAPVGRAVMKTKGPKGALSLMTAVWGSGVSIAATRAYPILPTGWKFERISR